MYQFQKCLVDSFLGSLFSIRGSGPNEKSNNSAHCWFPVKRRKEKKKTKTVVTIVCTVAKANIFYYFFSILEIPKMYLLGIEKNNYEII